MINYIVFIDSALVFCSRFFSFPLNVNLIYFFFNIKGLHWKVVYRSAQSPLPPPFLTWFYVSTQRKPEEESPVKDTDAKQAKQEATVNGSGDSSASNGNGVQEGKSQEASDRIMSYVLIDLHNSTL